MKLYFIFVVTLFLSVNSVVLASDIRQKDNCTDATSWPEKEICSIGWLFDIDIKVTDLYHSLVENLEAEEVAILQADQTQWRSEVEACGASLTPESNTYWATQCVKAKLELRQITLVIAESNNTYVPYREKKHCDKFDEQEFLECIILDLTPQIIPVSKKFNARVYEYPFIGIRRAKLLPGEEGKTYIIDLGGNLITASEIVGHSNKNGSPVFVIKFNGISGIGRRGDDDCSQPGHGRCSYISGLLAYSMEEPNKKPKYFSLVEGFRGTHLNLDGVTTSDVIMNDPPTYWDNDKGVFISSGSFYATNFKIEFTPGYSDWVGRLSEVSNGFEKIEYLSRDLNIRFESGASLNLGYLLKKVGSVSNEEEIKTIKEFLKKCAENYPDC